MGLSGLQRELLTGTLQGNMGKSSCFKLKHVLQANTFKETDTISLILLASGLIESYIDAVNLAFPSSIRCTLSAYNRFGLRNPS